MSMIHHLDPLNQKASDAHNNINSAYRSYNLSEVKKRRLRIKEDIQSLSKRLDEEFAEA